MDQPTQRVVVEGVELGRVLHFPRLLGACTTSLQPARLIIGLLMVVTIMTFGRIWDGVSSTRVRPAGLMAGVWTPDDAATAQPMLRQAMQAHAFGEMPAPEVTLDPAEVLARIREGARLGERENSSDQALRDQLYRDTERRVRTQVHRGVFDASVDFGVENFRRLVGGVLALDTYEFQAGLTNLVVALPRHLWNEHRWFAVWLSLVAFMTYVVGGGALARMAACQFAAGVRVSLDDAIDFALTNWIRKGLGLLLPLALAAGLAAVIAGLGVFMAAPVLEWVGGLVYGLALVLGFLMTLLLVGYAGGVFMIGPAVASECCDGPDAVQRVYAYVFQRPFHLLGYSVVAMVGCSLGFAVVAIFAGVMLQATTALYGTFAENAALSASLAPEWLSLERSPMDPWAGWLAGGFVGIWQSLVVCLVAAYVVAYGSDVATRVYLLMRRARDELDPQDIWWPGMTPGLVGPRPTDEAD